MNTRHRPIVLLACAILLPGCSVAGFTQTEHVSLDDGYRATQSAMTDLQFTVRDKSKDALQATVTAA